MPDLVERVGRGRWLTVVAPSYGTLWESQTGIGFQAVPSSDRAPMDALIAEHHTFDAIVEALIAAAKNDEHVKLIRRSIKVGDLNTWRAE
jgi:uncharacterized membrane protein YebE (DUF533 family)